MDPRRRAFVATLSAALATRSLPTNAQQRTSLRTVGVLMGLANDEEAQIRAKIIEQGLAKRGWVVVKISASSTGMPTATRGS